VSSFAVEPFLTGLGVTAAVSLVLFVGSWLVALVVGRFNIVDVVWGLSFIAIAATSYAWSAGHGADHWRRLLVLDLVLIWGARLAVYLGLRSIGKGEDPRYEAMLRDSSRPALRALGMVFVLQAGVAWIISLPVQAVMYIRSGWTVLAVVGVAVWVVGLLFEAVGDWQLSTFRNDPANDGQVMDRGLWRYSRHPNYFGDAAVWTGLWLIAAEHWIGAVMIGSPALMAWFLSFKTGKPLLEKHLARARPGYADYMRRTSGFFPLPPKKV
jgi:steroid 5-alpha reductase family enzyme